jgi:hypothetical protein
MHQKFEYLPAQTSKSDPAGGGLWGADMLLALGLLLSTATQLRPLGAGIGPGEICLVVWVLVIVSREAGRLDAALTPALAQLLIFWLIFAIALSVGTLAGYAIDDIHDSSLFLHDALAYPLLAAVGCLSVMGRAARARLHRVAWLLCGLGTALFAGLVAGGWGLLDISPIDPWYWDRFRGWSANPQQLALLCATLALLGLHLADAASRVGKRIAAITCASVAVYVGRLTKSDSFTVVLVIAGPVFMICKLWAWLRLPQRKLTVRTTLAWIVVLGLPLLAISALPAAPAITAQAEEWARELLKGQVSQEEAELRIHNWSEAMNRGMESGMLGLGPGPHIEIPAALVRARKGEVLPKYIQPPPVNGTPNFEAHNTPLDLFTQGGLIAVLSFVWLSGAAFVSTWKARLAGLTTLLCGVSLFGIGNLIIRQPMFWFTIALCLAGGSEGRTTLPARNWS